MCIPVLVFCLNSTHFRILLNRQEHTCPFWVVLRALIPDIPISLLKQKLLSRFIHDPELLTEFNELFSRFVDEDEFLVGTDVTENRYLS